MNPFSLNPSEVTQGQANQFDLTHSVKCPDEGPNYLAPRRRPKLRDQTPRRQTIKIFWDNQTPKGFPTRKRHSRSKNQRKAVIRPGIWLAFQPPCPRGVEKCFTILSIGLFDNIEVCFP